MKTRESSTTDYKEIGLIIFDLMSWLIMIIGPLIILGYQTFHWAKYGEWLPLPISVIGFESWKGIANLPLSLGVFATGAVLSLIKILLFIDSK